MTSNEQVNQLIQYIRGLSHFAFVSATDEPYNHMGATLTDTVLQAGVNYEAVVKPRVQRILHQFPEARTVNSFLTLLQQETPEKLLNWKPGRKPNTLLKVTQLLADEGIDTEIEVRQWLQQAENRAKLRAISGIGPKSVDYLLILVGEQTAAIDRHVYNFLESAGLKVTNYQEAHQIVSETARQLEIPTSALDYSIWQHMANKKQSQYVVNSNDNSTT